MRTKAIAFVIALALVSISAPAQAPVSGGKVEPLLARQAADHPDAELVVHLLFGNDAASQALREMESANARRASRRATGDEFIEDAEQRRVALSARVAELAAATENTIAAEVERQSGRVIYRAHAAGDVIAVVRANALAKLAEVAAIQQIVSDGSFEGQLDVSAAAVNANSLWNLGFLGGGFKIGLVDSGTDTAHPAFSGASIESSVFHAGARAADGCYADVADGDDRQGHGTHVSGIIASRGASQCPSCLGVARGATLLNLKAGYLSSCASTPQIRWSDAEAAMDSSPTAAVYNLSYGNPYTCDGNTSLPKYSCDDSIFSRWLDSMVDTTAQLVTISAGNTGSDGARSVSAPAIAYNIIAVANVDDHGNVSRSDDVIYVTSSFGPTANGRKKPDIAAPGTNIQSTNYRWESGTQFWRMTGTSMAAPHVASGIGLLLNAAASDGNSTLLDARAMKALLLNSAETRGAGGWDAHWGWGYLDLDSAYRHRNAVFVDSVAPAPGTAHALLYRGTTMGTPGKATLVWHRHPFTTYTCPTGSLDLNNLDLDAFNGATGSRIASSTSTIDNVEQVAAPAYPEVVLRVSAVCSSFGASTTEKFAIATEPDFQRATGPVLRVGIPRFVIPPNSTVQLPIDIVNDGDLAAHDVTVTVTVPPGFTLTGGANPLNIGSVGAHAHVTTYWTVAAPASGAFSPSAAVSSNSYDQLWTGSGSASWMVGQMQFELVLARPTRPTRGEVATPLAIAAGAAAETRISVSAPQALAVPIQLACDAPRGVTCELSSQSVETSPDEDAAVTLTLRAGEQAKPGPAGVRVTAKAGGTTKSLRVRYVVVDETAPKQ